MDFHDFLKGPGCAFAAGAEVLGCEPCPSSVTPFWSSFSCERRVSDPFYVGAFAGGCFKDIFFVIL